MPHETKRRALRKLQVLCLLILGGILYAEFAFNADHAAVINRGQQFVLADDKVETPFEDLVRRDPLLALMTARDRLSHESLDYACTFLKQERIGSSLSAEQEIEVKFRPEPYSVVMHWTRNEGMAKRVIYVKGKWVDESATDPELREQALCMPAKGLDLIVGKRLKQPIRGVIAKRTSRRAIDEFGFGRAMDLLIKYCEIAKSRNELRLDFRGESHFDGRPVWLVRRYLPYTGEDGLYPDRIADIYIDQELHIPVAVYCYSDAEARPEGLLGKYEYRNVRFNIGLGERDFDPVTYGM